MLVGLYTRISPRPKDKTDEREIDETVNQDMQLEEYCKRQGWIIYKRYKDILVSGSKKGSDRPEFSKMMEDARQKKFDLLLFWSLDRLSREGTLETLQYLTKLNSYGVDYKSYTEQYLDSCGIFKEAIIGLLATLAKQERIRIIERTKIGLDKARLHGTKSGKAIGRPKKVVDRLKVKEMRDAGKSVVEISKYYRVSIHTIYRQLVSNG